MIQSKIVLSTLNARFIHASLGLRYLYANLGELQAQTSLIEFIIKTPASTIVDAILKHNPEIVCFGVYIWNTRQTETVIRLLKKSRADIIVVIGGPEVSFEFEDQALYQLSDHIITGQADIVFKHVCEVLIEKNTTVPKVIKAGPFKLDQLEFPYQYYDGQDIANRVIYVEASRGCPFKCEFCLSSLDKTAYPFDTDLFLSEMQTLHQRGARTFKFVDRTFNLKIATSVRILEFFLERMSNDLFLHFELIPDNLPEPLKALIAQFPSGQLQFEIGIQTFTTEVQTLISRRQNNDKAKQNITWLKHNSHAHLHTDLIFGLPGETLASFASSFNQLIELGPDEIQLGILKRLRGTPISRHTASHDLIFNNQAPYEIISTGLIDEATVVRVKHFAKFWDKIANSGHFKHCLALLLGNNPFNEFLTLSDKLFQHFKRTHSIHLIHLIDAMAIHYASNPELLLAIAEDKKQFIARSRPTRQTTKNKRQLQHLQTADRN